MQRRVLVTRPEPGAARTANRLAGLGFEPVSLALTQTLALPVDHLPNCADAVAVTSANAVRHAPADLIAALAHLPCHAVGRKTADAARAAGFLSVHVGPGDAGGLAGEMAATLAGREVIYLCGRVRLATFEESLHAAGIGAQPIETYDTLAIERESADIAACLSGIPVDAVLLYSARAAQAMLAVVRRPELAHLFANTIFLCLSGRVAAALGSFDGEKIRISLEPNEDALLGLLRS